LKQSLILLAGLWEYKQRVTEKRDDARVAVSGNQPRLILRGAGPDVWSNEQHVAELERDGLSQGLANCRAMVMSGRSPIGASCNEKRIAPNWSHIPELSNLFPIASNTLSRRLGYAELVAGMLMRPI
jgi:hypothetical protein